jgi:hypothetical protein
MLSLCVDYPQKYMNYYIQGNLFYLCTDNFTSFRAPLAAGPAGKISLKYTPSYIQIHINSYKYNTTVIAQHTTITTNTQ